MLSLSKWHRWQDLLSLCHLLVCQRPGYPTRFDSPDMQRWLEQHLAQDIRQLHQQPAGHIWLADTPLYDISATEIRRRRHQNQPATICCPLRLSIISTAKAYIATDPGMLYYAA